MIKETTKNRSGNNLTFAIIIIAIIIRVMLHVRTGLTYWLYMLTHQCDIYGNVRSVKKLCTNFLLVSATSNYYMGVIVTIRSDSRYHRVEDRSGWLRPPNLAHQGWPWPATRFGSCNHHVGDRGGCNHEILLIKGGRNHPWRFGRGDRRPLYPQGMVGLPWEWLGVAILPPLSNDQCNASFV